MNSHALGCVILRPLTKFRLHESEWYLKANFFQPLILSIISRANWSIDGQKISQNVRQT